MTRMPLAEGLFVEEGGKVRLLASRTHTSKFLVFPAESGFEAIALSSVGTLFTWTTQEFRPPTPPYTGPSDFEPFGVGYVEFPEGILVEGRLTVHDPSSLAIGARMRTVAVAFGDNATTFAFAPVEDESA